MPELPEVEVVRRGLHTHIVDKVIADVQVFHPRAVRRHAAGAADFIAQLCGARIMCTGRRGKYLWLVLQADEPLGRRALDTDEPLGRRALDTDEPLGRRALDTDEPLGRRALDTDEPLGQAARAWALVVHLGMSGQMLVNPVMTNIDHVRITARLSDATTVYFVDQRTFGGWQLADLVNVQGSQIPAPVAHIARDPLDPLFDRDAVITVLRRSNSEIKRQLLNQSVVSGIGNIYADEALWRAQIHGARRAAGLTRGQLGQLLDAAAEVMSEALEHGGTSFDALYVNVNGQSGYFDRSLNVYGRQDQCCWRCATAIRREKFMNRSSFYCPSCQPRPRLRRVMV